MRTSLTADRGLSLRTYAATSLTDAGQTSTGKITVVLQMALCLVLLAGAGLLIRTLQNLQHISLGCQPAGLLVFDVDPTQVPRPHEELRVLAGVESVAQFEESISGQLFARLAEVFRVTCVRSRRHGALWDFGLRRSPPDR